MGSRSARSIASLAKVLGAASRAKPSSNPTGRVSCSHARCWAESPGRSAPDGLASSPTTSSHTESSSRGSSTCHSPPSTNRGRPAPRSARSPPAPPLRRHLAPHHARVHRVVHNCAEPMRNTKSRSTVVGRRIGSTGAPRVATPRRPRVERFGHIVFVGASWPSRRARRSCGGDANNSEPWSTRCNHKLWPAPATRHPGGSSAPCAV